MPFAASVNLGTVGDDITSVKLYACTDIECTNCVVLSGYTDVLVSSFPRNIDKIPEGTVKIKVESIGRCNVSQCISIIGIPTAIPTPTPTGTPGPTNTPIPTSTSTPTATPIPEATPTPTSTPIPEATPTPTPTSTPIPEATPTPTPTPTSTPIPEATPTPTPTSTPTEVMGQCYLIVVPESYNTTGYGLRLQLPGQSVQDVGFNTLLAEVGPLNETYYYVCSLISPSYVNIGTGIAEMYPSEITLTGPNGGCVSHVDCFNPEPTPTPTPTSTPTPTPTLAPGTPCIQITEYSSQDNTQCLLNTVPYYYTNITALLTDGNGNAMNAVGDVYAYVNVTENFLYQQPNTVDYPIIINNGTSSGNITITTSIPVDNGQGNCENETRVINSYSAQSPYGICAP